MLYSIVGILVVIIDQAVKFWVQNTLFGSDIVKFIPGVISLVNVHNNGAAFGILSGSDARIYFVIVSGVFALLVVLALATNFITGRLARWSLVMVAAGGIGNMIDRIIYGYVQDMFKVELFNFAIFNVADIFITVFAILFALAMIFEKPETDILDEEFEDEEEEEEDEDYEEKPERKPALGKLKEKRQAARSASKKSRQEKYEREYEQYRAQQLEAMNMAPARKSAPAEQPQRAAAEQREPAPERRAPRRPAQPQPQPQPQRQPAPAARDAQSRRPAQSDDPFAAWEKATAKHDSERPASYAERAMGTGVQSAQRPAARRPVRPAPEQAPARALLKEESMPAEKPAARPVVEEAPLQRPVERPVQPKAEPKPAAKPAVDDFDLDDILAEFK